MSHHKVDADKDNFVGYPSQKAMPGIQRIVRKDDSTGAGKPITPATRQDIKPPPPGANRR
jgi:hypothetical protein